MYDILLCFPAVVKLWPSTVYTVQLFFFELSQVHRAVDKLSSQFFSGVIILYHKGWSVATSTRLNINLTGACGISMD